MAFSGALTLTDLNDFITPSQACIKPVEQTNPVIEKDPAAASTQIQIDSTGSYYEVSQNITSVGGGDTKKRLETAQISLNDCLACSGCITSAESVLITMQSHSEVLNFLESNPEPSSPSHKTPVISIAPQSLASLAASLSSSSSRPISLLQVLRRVQAFCKTGLGFEHVFDTTFARHLSLLEHAQEFSERKKGEGKLPMLSSACPGWVCYAEKTHAEMLPFISRTKSPQQVMGTLVKQWLGSRWKKSPDQIYHVTVMPCYDKKLEASRQDFYNDIYSTRDVDCVITTGELELLMREKGWDLSIPVDGEDQRRLPSAGDPQDEDGALLPELISHPGTSSGSYLQSLNSMLMASSPSELSMSARSVRGADYEEYTLADPQTGAVAFRGAKCYGFRNLQNVVRKVGREAGVQVGRGAAGRLGGARPRARLVRKGESGAASSAAAAGGEPERGYDYVEVMACPGGCVNGGGQLRPSAGALTGRKEDEEGYARDWASEGVLEESSSSLPVASPKWGDKEWTKKVEEAYWYSLPISAPSPAPAPEVAEHEVGAMTRPTNGDDAALDLADRLAVKVLLDLCRPSNAQSADAQWSSQLDNEAETRRRELFRTQYRAVESEVVGLAVKW